MDATRTLFAQNRGLIINILYVIVALIVLYYIYMALFSSSDSEVTLLQAEINANRSKQTILALPRTNDLLRVKSGGAYTVSFWMYITSWDFRSGLAKSVLNIRDSSIDTNYLLTTILYPNEPKLMVRTYNDGITDPMTDYTNISTYNSLFNNSASANMTTPSGQMPMCDIQDIDMQRWINITISVNGRIVDVYYDGKLNRSCVLPGVPKASDEGIQTITLGENGGFFGKISGVQFFGYPLTPDRIYAMYQIGPSAPTTFVGYVFEKLGLNIKYSGYGGGVEKALIGTI